MSQNVAVNRGRVRAWSGAVVGLLGVASLAGAAHAQNVVTDFNYLSASNTAGSIGTWTYGQVASTAAFAAGNYVFTPLASSGTNLVVAGDGGRYTSIGGAQLPIVDRNLTGSTAASGTNVLPTDHLFVQAGVGGQVSVVRFTATAAGTYTFTGDFEALDTGVGNGGIGTTSGAAIEANGSTAGATALFSAAVTGPYNSIGSVDTFSTSTVLAAGQTVDLAVNTGANGSTDYDGTGLAANVSFVAAATSAPEPGALALIVPGMLGIVGIARRRKAA